MRPHPTITRCSCLDSYTQPAGAFIPYASGPRGCVGRPFAGVALRILLARVCAAFDFSPATSDTDAVTAAAGVPIQGVSTAVAATGLGGAAASPPLESEETERQEMFQQPYQGGKVLNMHGGREKRKPCTEVSGESGGSGMVGASGSVGSGSKEMQAGFTVLPGDGVHLRLRRWEE